MWHASVSMVTSTQLHDSPCDILDRMPLRSLPWTAKKREKSTITEMATGCPNHLSHDREGARSKGVNSSPGANFLQQLMPTQTTNQRK